jgi:2-haloacid dehalogenase
MSPTAVVFDLGNVLIRWDPHPAVAAAVGDEEATRFLAADDFDFLAWNHQQDAGRGWDQAEAEAARSHPHWAAHLRGYRAHFVRSLLGAVDDSVTVLEELHVRGTPLFALTNWSAELFPHAREHFGFLGCFADIVVSGEVGLAKPDPDIFRLLEKRTGHALADTVFIDDSPTNIAAAAALGMDAIHFQDTGHLREDLRRRGLPLAPAQA